MRNEDMSEQKNFIPSFNYEAVDKSFQDVKNWNDLTADGGPLQMMFKNTIERIMKAELDNHLGYKEKEFTKSRLVDNRRNGSSSKTVKTTLGAIEIDIPRDRDGTFSPKILPKHEKVDSKLETQIISMYAKGMTTRDISEHLKEAYCGVEISAKLISEVTDKILEQVNEWKNRPLDNIYPVVFLDGIYFKVIEEGKVINKAAHVVLGIDVEGIRDVLGIYIGNSESSSFWLSVLTDLKNRGVEDILITCIDGLKGFPDAIKTIYPKTEIQLCIVHQIRNSLKYISSSNQKEFIKDLKPVYKAVNEEEALLNLKKLEEKWMNKYPVVINSWKNNWENLSSYFKYTEPIRRLIYTTNNVEGLNRQLRKVTKNRSLFPTEMSLMKLIYLATLDVSKKWSKPRKNWPEIISQLAIHFEGRIPLQIA